MTEIQSIRCEAEFDAALARMDEIFLAEDGTPEGAERDALFDLIEKYDDEHYPIDSSMRRRERHSPLCVSAPLR